jgi:hopanoid-associated phosphorylase
MSDTRPIVAVVGMTREAKILDGAPALVGGGDATALAAALESELRAGIAGVVSFGLCGALDPALKVGDVVVADAVLGGDEVYEADPAWLERLAAALPEATFGRFVGAEAPVAAAAEKAELRHRTAAAAVDLESHVVARLARWYGTPFAVVRAVSDGAARALPHAAQVGLGSDGRPAIGAVLASLKRNPWQLGALIRTALEAEDGFHALERARQTLGPRFAGPQ